MIRTAGKDANTVSKTIKLSSWVTITASPIVKLLRITANTEYKIPENDAMHNDANQIGMPININMFVRHGRLRIKTQVHLFTTCMQANTKNS
jgi:hypothetical protein